MKYPDFIKLSVASAFLSLVSVSPAQAAPQILAVLESDVGIPFVCDGGVCKADLSTYCLQRERPAPNMGTVYHPAAAEDFTLTVTADGKPAVDHPANRHVTFIESRGFMAVSAVILEKDLQALGSTKAVIKVATNASMLPQAEPNDPDPLTEQEIAYATQSLRKHGTAVADRTPQAAAAQLLARLMQSLPVRGTVPAGASRQIWQNEIGDDLPADDIKRGGFTRARGAYEDCFAGNRPQAYDSARRCLEFKHDDLIRDINIDFWDSKVGS